MTAAARLLWALAMLTASASAIRGHEAMKYPPGVPPPKQQQPEYDIKFHQPSDFQNQPPIGHDPKNPSGHAQPPVGHNQPQAGHNQPPSGHNQPPVDHVQPPAGHGGQQRTFTGPPKKHVHTLGGEDGKLDLEHEKIHLKEHAKEAYVDVDQLDDSQLMVEYFRTFDLDLDGKIDGLEILKAMIKMNEEHDQEHAEGEGHQSNRDYLDMMTVIDAQMNRYDTNEDGIVTYAEFKRRTPKM